MIKNNKILNIIYIGYFYIIFYLGTMIFMRVEGNKRLIFLLIMLFLLLIYKMIISEKFEKLVDKTMSFYGTLSFIALLSILSVFLGTWILERISKLFIFFDIDNFLEGKIENLAYFIIIIISIMFFIIYNVFKLLIEYLGMINIRGKKIIEINEKHEKYFAGWTVFAGFIPIMTNIMLMSFQDKQSKVVEGFYDQGQGREIISSNLLMNETNNVILLIFFVCLTPYLYFLFNGIPKFESKKKL